MMIETKFAPGEYVCITSFNLNWNVKVTRIIIGRNLMTYEVEYPLQGEFITGQFYEDELSAIAQKTPEVTKPKTNILKLFKSKHLTESHE